MVLWVCNNTAFNHEESKKSVLSTIINGQVGKVLHDSFGLVNELKSFSR